VSTLDPVLRISPCIRIWKAVPEVKPDLSIVGMSNNKFHILEMPGPYFTLATIEFHEQRLF
jgi:hypothetical protein